MIDINDYDFELPEDLIAQHPLEKRDDSKLLVYDREKQSITDKHFSDIVDLLDEGDILVLNNSKVIPARIYGCREGKDESVEFLLLHEVEKDIWTCLCKPGKKAKVGSIFYFGDKLSIEVLSYDEEGIRTVKMHYNDVLLEILEEIGTMPLPPYIHEKLKDQNRYQTVYAKIPGSAAAPTAGLHFTEDLIKRIKEKGIEMEYITLNVGLGTFKPVTERNAENHKMHEEEYYISEEVADKINHAKKSGKKIVAIGTTTVRTLESAVKDGELQAGHHSTSIFIYPGYKFKMVDSLVTNFHLPKSTLIMLVSAIIGREKTLEIYKYAVNNRYRFFSFGDAMFIR